MSRPNSRLPALLAELKRRRVFRVAIVYGATAFVVVEAADLFFPRLALPEWTVTLVVALALLGFPIALVLAWAFEMTPEGVRRTEAADPAQIEAILAEPRRKRWPVGLAAAAATALLLVGVWYVGGRKWVASTGVGEGTSGIEGAPASLAEASGTVVAILPFSVQGSQDLAYLGEGMVNLLATKLDGAGELRAVDPRAVLEVVEAEGLRPGDPRLGGTVARRFGAGLYLVGDLVEVGGRIQLSADLHAAAAGRREPISEGAVSGGVDDLFGLVDELTAQLLSGLSGGPAARVKRIAAVTTSSLPALKAFLEGESLFRRGQFDAAVEAFQRAVEADSLFALAHYRLSLVAEWNFQDELARTEAERAAGLAARLSDRDRRLMEAFLVRRRGANAEAEGLYRSILGTYPNAMEAWLDLGEVLFHANPLRGRSFTESKEALYRVLEFDPDHATALIHLARIAAFERDLAGLDSLVTRFMALDPAPVRRMELDALQAFARSDEARIESTMRRLEGAEDLGVALAVWAAGVYARDLTGAERVARLLAAPHRSPEARRLAYAWLAHIRLAAGQWSAAREHLVSLGELSEGMALEYRALLCSLPFVPSDGCEPAELESALERLDPGAIPVSENPSIVFTAHDPLHPLIRFYLLGLTRARIGDAEGAERAAEALLGLELPRTAGSLDDDLARSVRAQGLISDGRDAEALSQLEQARMETWYGQTLASPLYSRVFERYVRAELLRKLGRAAEALTWYANLVETSPFELPYLAISHLRRAEIYEEMDENERAAEHYARFVELWSAADPELQPLVEDARAKLESRMATVADRDERGRSPTAVAARDPAAARQ